MNEKSFISIALCVFLSTLLDSIYKFILPIYLVGKISDSSIAFSNAFIMSAPLFFTLIAGNKADKFNIRKIILYSFLASLFTSVILLFLVFFSQDKVILVVVLFFIITGASIFFETSIFVLIPRVFSKKKLIKINSYYEVILSSAFLLAPLVGAFIFEEAGFLYVLIFSVASYSICFALFLYKVKIKKKHLFNENTEEKSYFSGFAIIYKDLIQKTITFSAIIFNFFHAMFFSLFVVFAVKNLGLSAITIGFIFSVTALVGIVIAVFIDKIIDWLGLYKSLFYSIVLIAPASLPIFLSNSYSEFFLILSLSIWEIAILINVVSERTLRQLHTKSSQIGTVSATARFLSDSLDPFGAIVGALLVIFLDVYFVLIIASIGMSLACLPYFIFDIKKSIEHVEVRSKS